jgi:hypothetical protein
MGIQWRFNVVSLEVTVKVHRESDSISMEVQRFVSVDFVGLSTGVPMEAQWRSNGSPMEVQ